MIKLKLMVGVLSLVTALSLTGCSGKGFLETSNEEKNSSNYTLFSNESSNGSLKFEFESITYLKSNFPESVDKLKSQTFDNINFEKTHFSFVEANQFNTFEYIITDFDISPDDAYVFMYEKLDELFPKMFSDEEKEKVIRFYDVAQKYDGDNIKEYPTLNQYKTIKEKGYPYILTNHPTTGINHTGNYINECYLDIMNGVLWGYDNGYLAERSGFDKNLNSFDVLNNFNVVYRTENLKSNKTFHLLSGDISIADAVISAEKCLSEMEISERKLPLKLRVQNVNVIDIGNNCYAFYFGIVPEYKGIRYNCILPDDTVFGFGTLDDTTNEREACGEAIMCEVGKLCRYRFLNPASMYDIIDKSSVPSIISLEDAAKLTSKYLTSSMEFKALSVSAVYKSFSDIEYKQTIDNESYEKRAITVRPCWRFVLQPLSGNTDRLYYIFVDMLTGEAYRTVQKMESEICYD